MPAKKQVKKVASKKKAAPKKEAAVKKAPATVSSKGEKPTGPPVRLWVRLSGLGRMKTQPASGFETIEAGLLWLKMYANAGTYQLRCDGKIELTHGIS